MLDCTIEPIPALKDNYIWIIINDEKTQAIIVDPGEAQPVLAYLEEHHLILRGILITHHHWDHTHGLAELIQKYSVPVFGSALNKLFGITHFLHENDPIQIDTFPSFRALEIPGHTLDHLAYYSNGILFSGDTLFSAGCGRAFEGTTDQLYTALQKLAALPDDTKIYCGHEYTLKNLEFASQVEPHNSKINQYYQKARILRARNSPTIPSLLADEREVNPFLRCTESEIIQNVMKYSGRQVQKPAEIFHELRKWKNHF